MRAAASLWLGAILFAVFVLAAALSLIWTPYDVTAMSIPDRMQAPSWAHPLGTDHFGRDILSMIMVGGRVSIALASAAMLLGLLIGVPAGLFAAANRGSVFDEALMRTNDIVFAFPPLVTAILLTAILGPSAFNAILAIAVVNIPVFARVTRGAAMPLWTLDYVLAARVAGKGRARISVEHVLTNILNVLIVQATITFSLGIIAEAGLSYIGLGVQPPLPSWGRMLAEAQTMVSLAPHMAIFPGLAIVLSVLGLNLMGDGLRDLLDPRIRRQR